ncbi:MAG: hypothetical protein AABZ92_03390, partial [Verrucomicrobiota bacterium]
MFEIPLLTCVVKSLSKTFEGIDHIIPIVSSFLLPSTLDKAVELGSLPLLNKFKMLPYTQTEVMNIHFDVVEWLIIEKQLNLEMHTTRNMIIKVIESDSNSTLLEHLCINFKTLINDEDDLVQDEEDVDEEDVDEEDVDEE